MFGFTPEQEIKLTLQQGSIFYFVEDSWNSTEPHYFIVINSNPHKDVVLLMVGATTLNIKDFSRITGYPKETFVDVTPDQCAALKKISMFNCNNVVVGNIKTLIDKLTNGKLKKCGWVEKEILERLIKGVKLSPNATKEVIKML